MAAPLAVLEPQLGLTQPSGGALRVPVVVASRCQEPDVDPGLLVVRLLLGVGGVLGPQQPLASQELAHQVTNVSDCSEAKDRLG